MCSSQVLPVIPVRIDLSWCLHRQSTPDSAEHRELQTETFTMSVGGELDRRFFGCSVDPWINITT